MIVSGTTGKAEAPRAREGRAKVVGEVIPEGYRVPLTTLLVCRVELQVRITPGEVGLPDGQRRQLVLAPPGEH